MKAFYSKPLLLFCLSEESNSYVCYPLKHIRKRTSTDAHRFLSFLVRTVAEPYAHLPNGYSWLSQSPPGARKSPRANTILASTPCHGAQIGGCVTRTCI